GEALEWDERLAQGGAPVDPVPVRQEAAVRGPLGRLDLLPERRERGAAETPQDVGLAPFALGPARPELAAHESVVPLELGEHGREVESEALARLGGRERPPPAGEPQDELAQRLRPALEEDVRQPARRHRSEGVAVPAGVLRSDETALRGHAHLDRPPLGEQDRGERLVVLAWPEVSPKAKDVVQFIRVPRMPSELGLHLLDRIAVEEVSELLLAEQLSEKVAVERERLCAPLRWRRVVFVHVVRDVVEEERGRIGRGRGRLHVDEIELPGPEPLEEPLQGRQVEDVLEALAVGLEDDRERAVAARDLEQALRLEALLPERRALARAAPRDQERARRVLAEPGAEERRSAELLDNELLDLVGPEQDVVRRRQRVRIREVERDPVVRPERVHLDPEGFAQPRAERERPRRVHTGAERREDADPPVADLVAEALDDH